MVVTDGLPLLNTNVPVLVDQTNQYEFSKVKIMKKTLISILIYIIFTNITFALGFEQAEIKKAVVNVLKDPNSVIFGDLEIKGETACIEVNAKNAFGGYTGKQEAILAKIEGKWLVAAIEKDISHALCVNKFLEVSKD